VAARERDGADRNDSRLNREPTRNRRPKKLPSEHACADPGKRCNSKTTTITSR
jgi:hypothetical protein